MSQAPVNSHYRELPEGAQGDITPETHLQSIRESLQTIRETMLRTEATLMAKVRTALTPEEKAGLQKLLRQVRRSPLMKGAR